MVTASKVNRAPQTPGPQDDRISPGLADASPGAPPSEDDDQHLSSRPSGDALEVSKTDEFARKRSIGRMLSILGGLGMAFFLFRLPESSDSIYLTAQWAIGTTISTIIAFAGFPGMFAGHIRSSHLKAIDLVWVLASAVAVVLALIQVSQTSANAERSILGSNIARARELAKQEADVSYRNRCLQTPTTLSTVQCGRLWNIGISLQYDVQLESSLVESLCPLPMDPSHPTPGFDESMVQLCIHAAYIARTAALPVMTDLKNVERWSLATTLWPLLMIMLVAVRVTKSIAEVFWKVDRPS